MAIYTIELDCAPGATRPGDLIDGVIEGTGLKLDPPVSRCFGEWTWEFDVEPEVWQKVQITLQFRITKLYKQGRIRYGSW